MAFSQFQYAVTSGATTQRTKIETNEDWVVDGDVKGIRLKETLGSTRILEVQINNPDGGSQGRYKAFQRVRLTDRRSNVVLFLGRVEVITPDHRKQHITLLCRDYMSELVEANVSVPLLTGNRRSDLVKRIIAGHDGRTWKASAGVFQATDTSTAFDAQNRTLNYQHKGDKNVDWWTHVDDSPHLEYVTKNYGSGSDAGYQSMYESIKGLSEEESWRDQEVLLYTSPTLSLEHGNSEFLTMLNSGDGLAGWIYGTAEMLNGTGKLPKPQYAVGSGSGVTGMRMYIGSSRQFSGLDIVMQKSTASWASLTVEYWNGVSWDDVDNITDGTNDLEQSGKITWRGSGTDTYAYWVAKNNLTGVESSNSFSDYFLLNKVSLYKNSYNESNMLNYDGSNFDNLGNNYIKGASANEGKSAGYTNNSGDNIDQGGNKRVTTLADPPLQNKFWIRLSATRDRGSVDPGHLFSLKILPTAIGSATSTDPDDYLGSEAKWDFRMQDPFFFDSVGYSTGSSNWTDNTLAATTKSASDNFNWFTSTSTSNKFYIGSEHQFGGIEFQLATDANGNYGSYTGRPRFRYWSKGSSSIESWVEVVDENSYAFNKDGSVRFRLGREASSTQTMVNDWKRTSLNDATSGNTNSAAPTQSLYWIEVTTNSGESPGISGVTRNAIIKLMRTISVAAFAYFERGTEPWNANVSGTRDGSGPTSTLRDAASGLGGNGGQFQSSAFGQEVVRIDSPSTSPRKGTVSYATDASSTSVSLSASIFPSAQYNAKYNLVNEKRPGVKSYDVYGDSLHTTTWHGQRNNWHGLTLKWRGEQSDWELPIYRYEIGDAPVDLMTRVTVYGREPSSFTAINKKRETEYGVKKHHVLYDRTLNTDQECKNKAEAVLRTFEPQSATTIRRGNIEIYNYPTYKYNPTTTNASSASTNLAIPRAVRVGDIINVSIVDGTFNLSNEKFLVWAIDYNDANSLTKLTVSQDLLPSFGNALTAQQTAVEAYRLAKDASQQNATPSPASARDVILSANDSSADPRARLHVDDFDKRDKDLDGLSGTNNNPQGSSTPSKSTIKVQKFKQHDDPLNLAATDAMYSHDSYDSIGGGGVVNDAHFGNESYEDAFAIYPYHGGALSFEGTTNDVTGTADSGSSGTLLIDAARTFDSSYIGLTIIEGVQADANGPGAIHKDEHYITEVRDTTSVYTSGGSWASGDNYVIKTESDIAGATGQAGLYYNTTDDTFKARVQAGAPLRQNSGGSDVAGVYSGQWHHVPAGEWGSITTNSTGKATILLNNTYAVKPVVLLTVDTSANTGGEQTSQYQKRWAEIEKMTDASNNVSNTAITKVILQVYQARLSLTSGGATDNVQITTGGALYSSDNTYVAMNTAKTADACRVMYMVLPPPRNSLNS